MVDLDAKLKEILHTPVNQRDFSYDEDDIVEQIKQAFAEAGYVTPENAAKVQTMVNQMVNLANDMAIVPTIQYVKPNKAITKAQNLMTGQEWYERFEKEFKGTRWYDKIRGSHDEISDAAKRAAGLTADSPTSDKPAHHHYLDDMTPDKLHGYEG